MKRRIVILLVAISGVLLTSPAEAQFCRNDASLWSASGHPITVYVNTNVASLCTAGDCVTFTDVERTVQHALNELYQTGSSFVRFVYAGPTSILTAYHPDPYTLHVTSQAVCQGPGIAFDKEDDNGVETRRAAAVLCGANDSGAIAWTSRVLQHAVIHEIGHNLGMAHTAEGACQQPDASMMKIVVESELNAHPQRYDIDYLQFYYGYRNNIGRASYSDDVLTWYTSAWTAPWLATFALGRFAATNSRVGERIFVSYVDDTYRTVYVSGYGPSSWTHLSSVFGAVTNYHTGVASRSDTDLRIAWLGSYNAATGLQSVYTSRSTNGGVSWTSPVELSDVLTRTTSSGVSVGYDPRTDKYVFMWRVANSTIQIHRMAYRIVSGNGVMETGPFILSDASGAPILAADTPSIACGDDGLVNTSCLVAWADGAAWQRPVRWFQANVNSIATGRLVDVTETHTHPYVSLGSPSVAYWDDGSYPWMIHVNQGGSATFTWRKMYSNVHSFQNEASYSYLPKVTLPAAGSRLLSGGGSRAYGFVLDQ